MSHLLRHRNDDAVHSLDSDDGGLASAPEVDSDSGTEASDGEQIQSALRIPPADATIPEIRKTLALCQKSLTETRATSKLRITTKELRTLTSALPAKKRKAIVNKTDALNEDIGRVAKKFAMLYRLWVIDGFFPIKGSLNPDVDPFCAERWDSLDVKRDTILTELFSITPESLHKEMVKYKSFGSVFTSALNQERSNMLRAVKEASALVFAPLKVSDTTIFASPARKQDDPRMKQLSMKNDMYHRIAPILFKDPEQVIEKPEQLNDGFLRSACLVNVLRLLILGKNSLTKEKARGGPRTRGQIHGIHCVTEGLIALAAIFVRYLLSPDSELQSVGLTSKIPYEADYDFYLQRLFKRSVWAIETIDFFNTEVFGSKMEQNLPKENTAPPAPARTWEDDFLNRLDNNNADNSAFGQHGLDPLSPSASRLPSSVHHLYGEAPPIHSDPHSHIQSSRSPSPATRRVSPVQPSAPPSPSHSDASPVATSNSVVSIHNHTGARLSSVSRLQVEVGQMSISGTTNPRPELVNTQTVSASGSRRISSARRAPVPIHMDQESLVTPVPTDNDPLVQKRTTRSRTKARK